MTRTNLREAGSLAPNTCPVGPRCERCGREASPANPSSSRPAFVLRARIVHARLGGEMVELCLTMCPLCDGAPAFGAERLRRATIEVIHASHAVNHAGGDPRAEEDSA